MMFIEVFVSKGTLSPEQRRQLGRQLIEIMSEESAPAEVIDAWHSLGQVVFYEPETWVVGGQASEPAPRYLLRVTVPGAWRKGMSNELIPRLTRVLAGVAPDPQRLYEEPLAWIHVLGVPEGGIGTLGKVMRSTDIIEMITLPFQKLAEGATMVAPPGMAIDPICGMTVALNDTAITLAHEGQTYAFCCTGCRAVFARRLGAASQ